MTEATAEGLVILVDFVRKELATARKLSFFLGRLSMSETQARDLERFIDFVRKAPQATDLLLAFIKEVYDHIGEWELSNCLVLTNGVQVMGLEPQIAFGITWGTEVRRSVYWFNGEAQEFDPRVYTLFLSTDGSVRAMYGDVKRHMPHHMVQLTNENVRETAHAFVEGFFGRPLSSSSP